VSAGYHEDEINVTSGLMYTIEQIYFKNISLVSSS
jgi:hypothetical protein